MFSKSLFLQRNALTVLPNSIGLLENIETLNISGNQLTSLPDTLRDCTELKYLDVSDNQLSHVRSLEHCQKLEKLNLEWNPLLEHPSYLVPLLRNLKEFIVDSSPIGSQQGQKRSARSMDSQSIPKTTIYMTPADCSHHANAEAGLVNSIGSKQDEEMSSQFLRSPNIPGTNNTATPAIVPNQVKIDPGVLLPSPMSSQEGQKLSFRSINSPIIPTSIKPSTLVDGSNHANIDPRVSPMISDIVATTGLTMKSQETTMDDQDVSGSTNAFSSFGTNLNRSKQGSTADPRNVSKYIFYPSGSTVNRLHHNSTKELRHGCTTSPRRLTMNRGHQPSRVDYHQVSGILPGAHSATMNSWNQQHSISDPRFTPGMNTNVYGQPGHAKTRWQEAPSNHLAGPFMNNNFHGPTSHAMNRWQEAPANHSAGPGMNPNFHRATAPVMTRWQEAPANHRAQTDVNPNFHRPNGPTMNYWHDDSSNHRAEPQTKTILHRPRGPSMNRFHRHSPNDPREVGPNRSHSTSQSEIREHGTAGVATDSIQNHR